MVDRRTTEHGYTYKLTNEPRLRGSGELKNMKAWRKNVLMTEHAFLSVL